MKTRNNPVAFLRRAAPALVAAFTLNACDLEVLNPGSILDEDLTTIDLMPILVAGVSAEFNDIGDLYAFDIARLTDDLAGTGSYFSTGQYRRGVFDNENSEGYWEQTHEAAWAAGEALGRLEEVLGGEAGTFEGTARSHLLMGLAHRILGENFCDVVYDKGPVQPREASFDSALIALNQAVSVGSAAGASDFVTAAQGGIAQAQVGLGNWSAAVSAAASVPTDFVHHAIYHQTANSNFVWNESWGRAEVGLWATPALELYSDDPRVPYTVCGQWDDPSGPSWGQVTPTGKCTGQGSGAHQGADGLTAHHRQDKYNEQGSDIPIVTGTEMRLIEAEAALINQRPRHLHRKGQRGARPLRGGPDRPAGDGRRHGVPQRPGRRHVDPGPGALPDAVARRAAHVGSAPVEPPLPSGRHPDRTGRDAARVVHADPRDRVHPESGDPELRAVHVAGTAS